VATPLSQVDRVEFGDTDGIRETGRDRIAGLQRFQILPVATTQSSVVAGEGGEAAAGPVGVLIDDRVGRINGFNIISQRRAFELLQVIGDKTFLRNVFRNFPKARSIDARLVAFIFEIAVNAVRIDNHNGDLPGAGTGCGIYKGVVECNGTGCV